MFQFFLNVDYKLAVGITLVIVMLYTSIGGFVSVVRTDVIQGLLMLIGSVMIFILLRVPLAASQPWANFDSIRRRTFSLT